MKTINYGIMQVQTDESSMKTPTKEQIEDIIYKHLPVEGWGLLMARIGDIDERQWLVEEIIRAWEKIRN